MGAMVSLTMVHTDLALGTAVFFLFLGGRGHHAGPPFGRPRFPGLVV